VGTESLPFHLVLRTSLHVLPPCTAFLLPADEDTQSHHVLQNQGESEAERGSGFYCVIMMWRAVDDEMFRDTGEQKSIQLALCPRRVTSAGCWHILQQWPGTERKKRARC